MKKLISSIIWLLIIIGLTIAGYMYYQHSELYPSTDDAYVEANTIQIAAQVTGPVNKIFVKDNQSVKKNQLLFTIDPRPFELAVKKANANLMLAKQQIGAQEAQIASAKAELAKAKANYDVVLKNAPRTVKLSESGQMSKAAGVIASGNLKAAKAAVTAAKANLTQAIEQLGKSNAQNANLMAAKANLAQAKLNLNYTKVCAPSDGYLVKFKLRPGTMVTASEPLFALIETHQWWINANYKETDLERIKPGQTATIKVDIYPNHLFKGYVQSLSSGSGAAFSLLPPENATGNWVKVTQRFPVKIIISHPDPQFPLRVGASATVTIKTAQ